MKYAVARGPPVHIIIETGGDVNDRTHALLKIVQIFGWAGEKHLRYYVVLFYNSTSKYTIIRIDWHRFFSQWVDN